MDQPDNGQRLGGTSPDLRRGSRRDSTTSTSTVTRSRAGRTSHSPLDGSPHHSPDTQFPISKFDKARIFTNPKRGRGRQTGGRDDRVEVTTPQQEIIPDFTTVGKSGREIPIVTNYFQVTKNPEWSLFQYLVNFDPEEDETFIRKAMVRSQKNLIGAYIFDGMKIFAATKILGEDFAGDGKMMVVPVTRKDDTPVKMILRYQGQTDFGDPIYVQFYNLIVRKCLYGMGLEEMGRNFFDHNMAIDFPALRIQLWPGYATSMRNHENAVLLCVEVTHKVIQSEDVLSVIQSIQSSGRNRDVQAAVMNVIQETIVMTKYNRLTYKIRGIDFNVSPQSSFLTKTGETTYMEYYRKKYRIEIKQPNQPLLIGKQTKFDPRNRGKEEGFVTLIPELCLFTGLTDAMRSNFSLMKELGKHLHMSPANRVKAVEAFMTRLHAKPELLGLLAEWGFVFQTQLVRMPGRVLPKENIIFANGSSEKPNDQADWTSGFRSQKLFAPTPLEKWVIIVTKRDSDGIENLIKVMQKVSTPLGFNISRPSEVVVIPDNKTQSYVRTIDQLVNANRTGQMVFVVLSTNGAECYAAVKKRLVVDVGIPSQCFLAKNLKSKGLMSIATKMCIQMCTKLGGEPWTVKFPLKSLMVIGFDTYGKKSPQVSAMVASLSATFTKYYSTISFSTNPVEKSRNLCTELTKCVNTYKVHNQKLPDWIVIYRDGMGDSEGPQAGGSEITEIEAVLADLYFEDKIIAPKLTYILISKKTNTRLMADNGGGRVDNVPPGTIVDHTITLPERYDFFLVSTTARQGTASPCSYNVIRDTSNMESDKLQLLTYKLCHLYFNWSGTVAVPAPCQYAHKLAALTAVAYERPANAKLSELLYYL